jgi:cytochrome bd-type quinol oxidase subunit 2
VDLVTLWFWLIALSFTLYFFLEGFDFGVDILRPTLARTEAEERALTGTIGPFWDGNEVWVIAAAGLMFSTFPVWYGAVFSGMYPLFVLVLLALLLRGVSFEYRNQVDSERWRSFWDWMSFGGSVVPSFLWGVIMAKIIQGLPVSAEGRVHGGVAAFLTLASIWLALSLRRDTLAFTMSGLTVLFATVTVFIALFTRGEVLPSTLDPGFGLTLQEAASQHYTLVLMTWVGGIFLPLIIGYQIWNYYVFRERVRPDEGALTHGY